MLNTNILFEQALKITHPWRIKEIKFDEKQKQLDIHIDFKKGASFYYGNEELGISGDFKAYDTLDKTW